LNSKYLLFLAYASLILLPSAATASPWNNSLINSRTIQDGKIDDQHSSKSCAAVGKALDIVLDCEIAKVSTAKFSNFEKALQLGAIYASKFVPTLNSQNSANKIGTTFQNDATSMLVALGSEFVNKKIQDIPFLSQTQIGVDFTSDADTTYYLNGVFKLAELGVDSEGKSRGLLFAQGNIIGTSSSNVTTNLGLGARKKINDNAMIGLNAFWDYRMTSYSSSYSRWGAGGEVWWNDFKLTNNWYIAGTGIKRVTTRGESYVNESDLSPGTYNFSEWASTNTFDERVVPGWDLGLNYRLPNYPQLSLGVRGFRWDYLKSSDNTGIEGTVNWQATPRTNLTAWVSNENPAYQTLSNTELDQRGSNTYYGLRFTIQLQPVNYSKGPDNLSDRLLTDMAQPVGRKNEVLLERWQPEITKTIVSPFGNKASGL
jgi:hypothetical protein